MCVSKIWTDLQQNILKYKNLNVAIMICQGMHFQDRLRNDDIGKGLKVPSVTDIITEHVQAWMSHVERMIGTQVLY